MRSPIDLAVWHVSPYTRTEEIAGKRSPSKNEQRAELPLGASQSAAATATSAVADFIESEVNRTPVAVFSSSPDILPLAAGFRRPCGAALLPRAVPWGE